MFFKLRGLKFLKVVEQIRPKRWVAVIRWVEPRDWVDKNRTRCHILCDHCHKTWHIRDMWQCGDNVSRGWLSGKMIAKQDLNFVYNQLKGRGWDCSLELGHKATESVCVTTLLFVRDCVKAPGAARWISEWTQSRDHGVLATYSVPSLDVSPVGQNGAILIWYSMEQFLCGFWKQNYFSILTLHSLRIITALPQSWLHSLYQVEKWDWNWN